MNLSEKERSLLQDLQKQEQTCIDKYSRYSGEACDGQLKNLFSEIQSVESSHLNTINQILNGSVPSVGAANAASLPMYTPSSCDKQTDAYLCTDALSTEKHVSSEYNTCIFEFVDTNIRNTLNHIQKEEQQHGEQIYNYMHQNGMY